MSSNVRVRNSATRSLKARTDLAALIAKQAPNSALVQGQPALKASCDAVTAAGVDLTTAITGEQAAKALYLAARSNTVTKTKAFDAVNKTCVAQTEQYASTPQEVQGVGYDVAVAVKYPLAPPNSVQTSYDLLKALIVIEVKQPPGMRACIVEICSGDPAVATSWQRLDGNGIRRTIAGFAPGTYWVRVANTRARAKSAYSTPVSVIVK